MEGSGRPINRSSRPITPGAASAAKGIPSRTAWTDRNPIRPPAASTVRDSSVADQSACQRMRSSSESTTRACPSVPSARSTSDAHVTSASTRWASGPIRPGTAQLGFVSASSFRAASVKPSWRLTISSSTMRRSRQASSFACQPASACQEASTASDRSRCVRSSVSSSRSTAVMRWANAAIVPSHVEADSTIRASWSRAVSILVRQESATRWDSSTRAEARSSSDCSF